jgi:hypothetical protein
MLCLSEVPVAETGGQLCEGVTVSKLCDILLLMVAVTADVHEAAAQQRPTRFWNLTKNTISEFYLAPAGTSDWGPNQCQYDKDGRVDFDERLAIRDVPAGVYDVKFTDTTGRTCTVQTIEVNPGAIFSIQEKDLTSCENR